MASGQYDVLMSGASFGGRVTPPMSMLAQQSSSRESSICGHMFIMSPERRPPTLIIHTDSHRKLFGGVYNDETAVNQTDTFLVRHTLLALPRKNMPYHHCRAIMALVQGVLSHYMRFQLFPYIGPICGELLKMAFSERE